MDINPAVIVILAVIIAITVMIVKFFHKEAELEDLYTDIMNYVDTLTDLLKAGVDITEEVIQHSVAFAQELGLNVTTDEIQQWVDEYLSFLNIQLAEEDDTGEKSAEISTANSADTNAPSKSDIPNDAPIDDVSENDTIDQSDLGPEVIK